VIPIYLSLVRKGESVRAHQIIVTACSAVASLLVVAALFGKHILAFFNVGLDDFRIAGGLLALASAGINFILTGIKDQLPGLVR
jgi:multiple antibiotic resistance protein